MKAPITHDDIRTLSFILNSTYEEIKIWCDVTPRYEQDRAYKVMRWYHQLNEIKHIYMTDYPKDMDLTKAKEVIQRIQNKK
tara:strand:- start:415 stop:657 length:243 start_codon:yes stop_codon:yes gene_type:complete